MHTWKAAEIFSISHSSLRDREQVITSSSASSFCSRDGPGSSPSLTKQTDFTVYFFFSTEVTDTDTGWFFGSAAVPVTGVGVAAVSVCSPSLPPDGTA